MVEFVFVSLHGRPLGQEVLRKELEKAQISAKIFSMDTLFQNIFDKGERRLGQKEYTQQFREGVREYLKLIKKSVGEPTFFGMTMFDAVGTKQTTFVVSKEIKKAFPNSTLIAGGPAFNSNPTGFLRESNADYAIRGEAEKSLVQLVKLLTGRETGAIKKIPGIVYRGKRKVVATPLAKLSLEEIINSEFTYLKDGKFAITYTERGCPNACVFCTVPRKGTPAKINEPTILQGIVELAKNPQIKVISLQDDQFFLDKLRANRILDEIIRVGLNKRFRFDTQATVESLLKNGKVDVALIRKIRRAGITGMALGVEALNNNMLRELKGGRYTKEQAIELLKELNKAGIYTENFLLAGGIKTRARDFIESYYNALRLEQKGIAHFYPSIIIQANKGTAIHTQAEKEKALATINGREVRAVKSGRVGVRVVLPKDEHLRALFVKKLQEKKERLFTSEDIPSILKMAQETKAPIALKYARKIQRMTGQRKAGRNLITRIVGNLIERLVEKEMKKQNIPLSKENIRKFWSNSKTSEKITIQAEKLFIQYRKLFVRAQTESGIKRLRTIQEMRKRTGAGMTHDYQIKRNRPTK
jgi:radical SAM superfamily enzyme YgiQ (UPF0313 family)